MVSVQAALAQTAAQLESTRAKLTQQGEQLQHAQHEVSLLTMALFKPLPITHGC